MRLLPFCLSALLVVLAGCSSDDDGDETDTVPVETTAEDATLDLPTAACDEAFAEAAQVGDVEDTVEDLYPATQACESLADWTAGSETHPDALDGADPEEFAVNVCQFGGAEVAASALCGGLG